MKPLYPLLAFTTLLLLTVILTLIYPTPDPCIRIEHIGSDSFGERYLVAGHNWSGYMVTDRPVSVWGECGVEVSR